jgi:putative ABC transport system permease protein
MFRNYLKSALRNIRKQKGYSFLNISGLALGMACSILIIFYIQHELSYDRFHENADRIYRISMEGRLGGEFMKVAPTPTPLAPSLLIKYPEVVKAARIRKSDAVSVEFADKKFIESAIVYADPGVFDVFTFPLLRGDVKTALARPYTVVLTERTAKKYFGLEDPIGKFLKFDNQYDFAVTGVIRDISPNSHLKFDVAYSMETFFARRPSLRDTWLSDISGYTYVLLDRRTAQKPLEAKLPGLVEEKMGKVLKAIKGTIRLYLEPLTSIHLRSKLRWEFGGNGDILYIYIFAAIAVIILAIACINFMNLATARSARRAREVGIRKVVGACRRDLVGQFLGESTSTSLLALIVSLVFVQLALPLFKSISGIELRLGAGELAWLVPMFFGLALFVGFAAGSYPAIYLSAFQPVKALKGGPGGSEAKSGSVRFRRLLVVGQFALSIAMITGTWIIGDQIRYMKNKDIGFQKEQVLGIRTSDQKILKALDSIKSRLKEIPGVLEISATSFVPGAGQSTNAVVPEGFEGDTSALYRAIFADADFVRTMGMEIAKGRDFSKDMLSDAQDSILINETAVRKLGWDNPVGKTIKIAKGVFQYETKTVVGVVRDFNYASLRDTLEPLFISNEIDLTFLVVKLKTNNMSRLIGEIRKAWTTISPGSLFDYFFIDELFDAQYRSEERLNKIFSSFSLIAIAIASLGLFGLASYMAERRKKEVGIRKVLGASLGEVVGLLAKEFLKLVGLAALIAWPIAYFAMNVWLRGFAYRTQINLRTFAVSALAALAIAFLTVSYQAVRAALADPVDSLKYE